MWLLAQSSTYMYNNYSMTCTCVAVNPEETNDKVLHSYTAFLL